MPTLTIRIEEDSAEHLALEKIKSLFDYKTNTAAIDRALIYCSKYNEHLDIDRNLINERDELKQELSQIKDLIRRKNEIERKLSDYALND